MSAFISLVLAIYAADCAFELTCRLARYVHRHAGRRRRFRSHAHHD